MPFWKKALFYGLMLAGIPLCFFGIFEACLQIAGYGGKTRFFYMDSQSRQWIFDESRLQNWLRPRKLMPDSVQDEGRGRHLLLPAQTLAHPKPRGSLRVLCIGASTVQGFPHQNPRVAFPAQLQNMLRKSGQDVEILNFSISAVGSTLLLEMLKHTPVLEPDAIVLYAGHNEFAGYLGTASNAGFRGHDMLLRWHLRLAHFKFYGFFQDLLGRWTRRPPPGDKDLIEFLPQNATPGPDHSLFRETIERYTRNLEAMVRFCRQKQIPLIFCTVASNQRDFPPFQGYHEVPPAFEMKEQFVRALMAAEKSLAAGDTASAGEALAAAEGIDPRHAGFLYASAAVHLAAGRLAEARTTYQDAVDRDGIKLRAPAAINEALRAVATRYELPLADMATILASESAGGIPGSEWFLEHVHPSLRGHTRMAAVLRDTLVNRVDAFRALNVDKAMADGGPFTPVEEWVPELLLASLTRKYPFRDVHHRDPPSIPEALQPLVSRYRLVPPQVMHLSLARYFSAKGNTAATLLEVEAALHIDPHYRAAREFAEHLGRGTSPAPFDPWHDTRIFYETLVERYPAETSFLITQGYLAGLSGDKQQALHYYRKAHALDGRNHKALTNLALACRDLGQTGEAIRHLEASLALNAEQRDARVQLGLLWRQAGQPSRALAVFQEVLRRHGDDPRLYSWCGDIQQALGDLADARAMYYEVLRIAPDSLDAGLKLGNLLLADTNHPEGSRQEAYQLLSALRELHPKDGRLLNNLGTVTLAMERFAEAREILSTAIRYNERDALTWFNLALVHEAEGNLAQALETLEQGMVLQPGDPMARELHARWRRQLEKEAGLTGNL